MKKIIILAVLAILLVGELYAQQRPRYSQYMFSQFVINPAYAGNREAVDATLIYRSQWANISNAPVTQTLSAHLGIPEKPMGLGLLVVNSSEGVRRETTALVAYSYTIPITEISYRGRGRRTGYFEGLKLAVGFQTGFDQFRENSQDLKLANVNLQEDPAFQQGNINSFLFEFGMGLFLYSKLFYFGASVPNFLKTDLGIDRAPNTVRSRHIYLTTGIIIPINNWLDLKPRFLVRIVEGSVVQYDANINAFFLKKFWLGFSYRHKESIVGIFKYQITNNISAGYSYDYGINSFTRLAGGSHEVSVNYFLKFKSRLLISPRYF